jgi:hypothetical protein
MHAVATHKVTPTRDPRNRHTLKSRQIIVKSLNLDAWSLSEITARPGFPPLQPSVPKTHLINLNLNTVDLSPKCGRFQCRPPVRIPPAAKPPVWKAPGKPEWN